jgi:VWFA-related protein
VPADQAVQDESGTQDEPQPVFRGGINFVRVDAIVTDDDDKPIVDLEPSDFEVSEDGEPQTIETFKRVDLDGGFIPGANGPPRVISSDSVEESEAARDDVRLFGIFLDDYHVRLETGVRAREDLARFIETQLGPSDMVGLMYPLAPLDTVRFTRNHGAVERALLQFEGRKYRYEPMNQFEYRYSSEPTEVVERIRNQVSLSAIEALIVRMGSLKEGRKALILVTEGYSNYVPPQLRSGTAGSPDYNNPAYGNPLVNTNSTAESRAQLSASADLQMDLREVYAAANRYNVALYPVDPRGLATGEFGIDQNVGMGTDRDFLNSTLDTLRVLASETDGRAIINRNALTLAMKQIVVDSSSYYMIGYASTAAPTDGEFHEITVRVRRPGVKVRARKGYWAITASDLVRAEAPPKPGPRPDVQAALASLSVQPRARTIRTWIGTERGDGGNTRVTFVWEPSAPTPGAEVRPTDVPAQMTLTASGEDGTLLYRGRIPEPTAGPTSQVTFEVPPGPMRLRLAVENADADVLDSDQRDLDVPDLTAPVASLSTPAVFRARTVREMEQIKVDPQATPTTMRVFSRIERVLLRLSAYGPGGSTPPVTARLLNRSGDEMNELPVTSSADGRLLVELPLSGLAPGEYLVEVIAGEQNEEARQLIGFRVTG